MIQSTAAGISGEIGDAVLHRYVSAGCRTRSGIDPGMAVVAGILTEAGEYPHARPVLHRWLSMLRGGISGYGLLADGLAGMAAGLHQVLPLEPKLAGLAGTTRSRLAGWAQTRPWQTEQLDWPDYDLVSGPAGILLSLLTSDPAAADESVQAVATIIGEHLIGLCADSMSRFRIGVPHPGESRSANLGRLNTGMAHGIAGVVAALAEHYRWKPSIEAEHALRTATSWLIEHHGRDDQGIIGWHSFHRPATPLHDPPQAWCYGTPGIAWTLWHAGWLLGEVDLCDFATAAMDSLAGRWDCQRHLSRREDGQDLAVCHGAAGVLLVADSFARHAGLDSATGLRAELTDYLHSQASRISELAEADVTLLSGAAGVLAALATAAGGSRSWLPLIGLR
jgi:lantibiotic biosynthesis protein